MSGILGLFNLDGQLVEARQLHDIASILTRRGPDRTGIWHEGSIGLGHTLLATTPEMLIEDLPLKHVGSGCVITGDVRLDNRDDLLANLGMTDEATMTGDGGLVLAAYLRWGEACVERFLGDFAFSIWDPRHQQLFCARDHMGMRQLVYHHSPGRFFAFATAPRAILVLPQTPYRINEARIADFLVWELEGIDHTSTFFEEVFRLPPAHTMTVTPEGMRQRRYWTLEAGPELRLPSNRAYAEAFLDVFTEAVRSRLRTVGSVGSMLSGGTDSGSVVAIARRLLAEEGRGPLLTFSAVSPDGDADVETRTIEAALTMEGLDPTTISFGALEEVRPRLEELTTYADEPFDGFMTLVRAVYLTAHGSGLNMLLDGIGGDVALTEGRRLARLLRAGSWRTAYREARQRNRFWGGSQSPLPEVMRSARAAFIPDAVLRHVRPLRIRARARRTLRTYAVDKEFARRVDLLERLQRIELSRVIRPLSAGVERATELRQPHVTVARERCDRVAAAVGIEPRDPFMDPRLLTFCVRIPDSQISRNGWPKAILRHAMAGHLPDSVRWRPGREHLGWAFTTAFMGRDDANLRDELTTNVEALRGYVDAAGAFASFDSGWRDEDERRWRVYHLTYLREWLRGEASNSRKRDDRE